MNETDPDILGLRHTMFNLLGDCRPLLHVRGTTEVDRKRGAFVNDPERQQDASIALLGTKAPAKI